MRVRALSIHLTHTLSLTKSSVPDLLLRDILTGAFAPFLSLSPLLWLSLKTTPFFPPAPQV